jgi:hypothetical protein
MKGIDDTSPEAERVLVAGYRRMSPAEKLQQVVQLNRALDQLAEVRIRETYGADIPQREVDLRLAALRLDRQTMIRVFDWDPEEQGY